MRAHMKNVHQQRKFFCFSSLKHHCSIIRDNCRITIFVHSTSNMRNITCKLIVIICCFFAFSAEAQYIPYYSFSQNTGTYNAITGGTVLGSGTSLANQRYSVSLPFSFMLDGDTYTSASVGVNGILTFGADPGSGYWQIQNGGTGYRCISGFDYDLAGLTSASEISYTTLGTAPNRIFVVQWKNMNAAAGTALNASFQVQLLEAGNQVKITYGSCSLTNNSSIFVQVGLRGLSSSSYLIRNSSTGSWTATTNGTSTAAGIVYQTAAGNPPSGLTFSYSPPMCSSPSQLTSIGLVQSFTNINLSYSGSNASSYIIVRTPGANTALNTLPINGQTYAANSTLGNGTVIYNGTATTYNNTGLTMNTDYTYTVFPYNNTNCIGGPLYNTTSPVSGTTQTFGPKKYTWISTSGSTDWTVSTNWSPGRLAVHQDDTLFFNSGTAVSVSNVPTETYGVLHVTANTNLSLNTASSSTINHRSLLQVDTGSSLTLGAGGLTLGFAASGAQAKIYGNLTLSGSSAFNAANATLIANGRVSLADNSTFRAANGTSTFNAPVSMTGAAVFKAATGTTNLNDTLNLSAQAQFDLSSGIVNVAKVVNNNGPSSDMRVVTASPASTVTFGPNTVYNHRRDGGYIPQATWDTTSTVNITGVVSTNVATTNVGQAYGTLIWNCPGQTSTVSMGNFTPVLRDLKIISTGAYAVKLGNTPITIVRNLIQDNGTLQLSNANRLIILGNVILNSGTIDLNYAAGQDIALTIAGNLIQGATHTLTKSNLSSTELLFNGTVQQQVSIAGTIAPVSIDFELNNPAGAVLTGNPTMANSSSNIISAGSWIGPGAFVYSGSSRLVYNLNNSRAATPVEWPQTSQPALLTLALTNTIPNNRLSLPGDRALSGSLTISGGVLVLSNYNLAVGGTISILNPDSAKMIAANGTGYLIRPIAAASSSTSYLFPIGDIDGIPGYSPVTLQMISNTTARNIGVRVNERRHPNDAGSAPFTTRYWSFIDDGGNAAYRYKGTFDFPYMNLTGNYNLHLNRWNGAAWSQLPSTAYANGALARIELKDTLNQVSQPLNGSDFAGRPAVNNTYSWTGTADKDFNNALNWNPNRVLPDPTDILQFNSGRQDTILSIPTQNITRMLVNNNTSATLMGGNYPVVADNLIINSDADASTNELNIESGSSLILAGGVKSLTLSLSGDSCTAVINGRMEAVSSTTISVSNRFEATCTGCRVNIPAQGVMAVSGLGYSNSGFGAADSNSYNMAGTYEVKTQNSGGNLLNARWADGSVIKITGYTTALNGPAIGQSYSSQNFYKIIYDCPNQSGTVVNSMSVMRVRDTFIVRSTGAGKLSMGNANWLLNHYLQTDGNVDLSNNDQNGTAFVITGSFRQTAGTFFSASSLLQARLQFAGTNGTQSVTFADAAPMGRILYEINNPAGIQLQGTGALSSDFFIRANGGMTVMVPNGSPVSTSLNLKYQSPSTLSFTGTGNIAPDSLVFPATDGPDNVTVNIGYGNTLTMPGSRTIPRTLTMAGGNIYAGPNNITIGTSAVSPGTLGYQGYSSLNVGDIILTTGSLTRWFGTTGLPTAPDAGFFAAPGVGFFPIAAATGRRHVAFYFSTATALSSGGTITVSHNNASGQTNGLNVTDGAYLIDTRHNASWSFSTGNGISATQPVLGMRITAEGLFSVNNPANLRIMQANAVVGNHVNGTGAAPYYMALRNGLSLSDINAASYYIGSASANIGGAYISVKSGDWNAGSTWDKGTVPGINDLTIISPNDTVRVNSTAAARAVYVSTTGALEANNGNFTIDSAVTNVGTITVNGGNVTLGPSGGGKAPFIDSAYLNVYNGNLTINGYLSVRDDGTFSTPLIARFTQSGGHIYVDGNANGVIANSAPVQWPLVGLGKNVVLTGGILTIVDPHAAASSTAVTLSGNPLTINNITAGHTIELGDGVSTTPGGYTNGFYITSNTVGKLVVKGSAGTNRLVMLPPYTYLANFAVLGDLVLTGNNALFNANGTFLSVAGDVTVNAGTTLNVSTITFGKAYNNGAPATVPQLLSGTGTINTGSGATFTNIYINNTSATGVTFDIGDVICGSNLGFIKGCLNMANNSTLKFPAYAFGYNAGASTGWVRGKISSVFTTGSNQTETYPVGTLTSYTPVALTAANVTANTGYTVSVTNSDHPAIAASGINPAKSVNLYYTVTADGTSAASGFSMSAGWATPADIDAGAIWPNFMASIYNGTGWNLTSNVSPASGKININGLSSLEGVYVIGEAGRAPAITVQPANSLTCTSSGATFSVTATAATAYQWQVNPGSGWTNTIDGALYGGSASPMLSVFNPTLAMNNYQYRCIVSNNADSATSNVAILSVSTSVLPVATINANPGTSICAGTSVTFTVNATNGGVTPSYQWKKNGLPVGTGFATYTDAGLNNNDIITCDLQSSNTCATVNTVSSNSISMVVTPSVRPTVAISANPGISVCQGAQVTYTATGTNGGTNPTYIWYKNASQVNNAAGATYTDNNVNNSDNVYCIMVSNATCALPQVATSGAINMTVTNKLTPSINISSTSTNICAAQTVTFNQNTFNGGTSPSYQWFRNGLPVGNGTSYTGSSWSNGDVISCVLTSSLACVTSSTATSNSITLSVTPSQTPTIAITTPSTSVCASTPVTFTSIITNGGIGPSYTWYRNTTVVGNSATYTLNTPANNDVIRCVMTSSLSCTTPSSSASSNNITLTVSPVLTPTVTISANPGNTICSGTNVTFTAVTTNEGTTPLLEWFKNGSSVGTGTTYSSATLVSSDLITCKLTSSVPCPSAATVTSNGISMTVTTGVPPTVTIAAAGGTTVCQFGTILFSATGTNTGGTTTYLWKKNGVSAGTGTTYSYTASAAGDIITCELTTNSTCAGMVTVTSNAISPTVNPQTPTAVSIAASPGATICANTTVTFTATPTNPGTAPVYEWRVNNIISGTNSPVFTSGSLANNDIVTCAMTSSVTCPSSAPAVSNPVTMIVSPALTPTITVSTNPGSTICAGATVTFSANHTNAGTAPAFDWKKNGISTGVTAQNYTSNSLVNGDVITCTITGNMPCNPGAGATSPAVTMNVNSTVTPTISITGPTTACDGENVSFNASTTNPGNFAAYVWRVNGVQTGSNSAAQVLTLSGSQAVVTCRLQSNASCRTVDTALSNAITVNLAPSVTPSVSITASPGTSITSGQLVTFTATAANAGTTPVFQWTKNSVAVGGSGNTYSSSTLQNNDLIQVTLHSSERCVSVNDVQSNGLTITVATGVGEINNAFEQLQLFPNPNQGIFIVKGTTKRAPEDGKLTLTLYSPGGQSVYKQEISIENLGFESKVTLPASLSNGVYTMELRSQTERAVYKLTLNR